MKPTAAPAPSLLSAESGAAPEAGQSVDAVYDPQDASADWSGFAPRHSSGRRMHAGPAAHREVGRRDIMRDDALCQAVVYRPCV